MVREVEATLKQKLITTTQNMSLNEDIQNCEYVTKLETSKLNNNARHACSCDIGWQKRAGGTIYDFISGHGYMIGCKTGKIVGWGVMKKKCKTCEVMKRKYDDVHPYECSVNYEGSSGAMESKLAVESIHKTWNSSSSMVSI